MSAESLQGSETLFQYGAIGVILFLTLVTNGIFIRYGMRRMQETEDFVKNKLVDIHTRSVEATQSMVNAINVQTEAINRLWERVDDEKRKS